MDKYVVDAWEFTYLQDSPVGNILPPFDIYYPAQMTHHVDMETSTLNTVQVSTPYRRVEKTMSRYAAHLVLKEMSLLNQTRLFSWPKAFEAFDIRRSSSASSLFWWATVEPRYLKVFT